jgi:hypothetical protein
LGNLCAGPARNNGEQDNEEATYSAQPPAVEIRLRGDGLFGFVNGWGRPTAGEPIAESRFHNWKSLRRIRRLLWTIARGSCSQGRTHVSLTAAASLVASLLSHAAP